ncbi:MAG: hypothetical protein ACYC77_09440 [Coriobacteriia bacterium]
MHPDTLTGPLAIFLQGLAFVLVAGALFVLVHALGRKAERWKHSWSRWVWVVLAAEYVLSFAAAMIVTNDTTATVFGFSYVAALVVDVTYLLRVVFPARRERPAVEVPADAPVAEAPEAPDDLTFE